MQPELTGYTDRFSVASGQRIRFMVSTDAPAYEATLVRLIHADENPAGPGFKEEVIDNPANKQYAGRKQITHAGSFVLVEHMPQLESFTLQAWIYPTTPGKGQVQGIITQWSQEAATGYALVIGENGDLNFWLGRGNGQVERISTGKALRAREWYFVTAAYDAAKGQVRLYQLPGASWPDDPSSATIEQSAQPPVPSDAPLLFAAAYGEDIQGRYIAGRGLYNGKIDNPHIVGSALQPAEIESFKQGTPPSGSDLIASWDFADGISTSKVTDRGRHGLHGKVINMPCRAVTGHKWTGEEVDFKRATAEYGAIHFHEDDLDDARWETDFELTIPEGLRSGIYAARLTAGAQEDYIPFVVRPPVGKPSASVLVLLPTMTYLAYANYRSFEASEDENGNIRQSVPHFNDTYLSEHPEFSKSLYDLHTDGSGFCYSSRLRPILNMRPKYRWGLVGAPRHFPADLYLPDWLEEKGIAYDVVTDEDLHFDGLGLLENYRVLMTGTHPEYWTTPMSDALEAYLAQGGKLMYLGGNGFYWITSVDPERPHMVEVRRSIAGTRAWESAPGELYHSTTGEYGGLWRHRGRAPNRISGVGFTAQGWDNRPPGYDRKPDSFNERAAFIFAGIGKDEVIGDFGLALGGAAGDEIDRADYRLGTPYHTLLLASASGYDKRVMPVIEGFNSLEKKMFFEDTGTVRADMVYFETPSGGEVFSSSAITWCASLSHNHYDNNVSRITENVVRKFMGA